jgi:hypothetical protein
MNNDLKFNGSGYRDTTAEKAIRAADHTPPEIGEIVDIFRKIAGAYGYEIENRVHLKSKKTGIIFK